MSIWMSSGAFGLRTVAEVLDQAEATDISHIELASGLKADETLPAQLQRADRAGQKLLVHNYFPAPKKPFALNIAALDPAAREVSVRFAETAIGIAADAGAPFYSVHAGFAVALTADMLGKPEVQSTFVEGRKIDREASLQVMDQTVRHLADVAADQGIGLLIENNVVTGGQVSGGKVNPLLLTDPDECASFFNTVDRPNVGLLLDVGHARVSGQALGFDPAAFFDTCAPWLKAFHLSDNDGLRDSNQPIQADSWFLSALQRFADLPKVIEVYNIDAETMHAQIALVRRAAGV